MKRVLFVCLGNICRSPAAEGVMKHLVSEAGLEESIDVDSAGTLGYHSGEKADSRMRKAALARGIELTSRARQIVHSDFNEFDFIITMDESNYRNCEPMRRENSRAELIPFKNLVSSKQVTGVPDPYYGGPEGFEHVLDLLEEGCGELLKILKSLK